MVDLNVADERERFIEEFVKAVKKDARLLKYINLEDIVKKLNDAICFVRIGDPKTESFMAVYNVEEKSITCRPEYRDSLINLVHEVFHALNAECEKLQDANGKNVIIAKNGLKFYYEKGSKLFEFYETGRGLCEGIAQYFARHVIGPGEEFKVLRFLGLNLVKDCSYIVEQTIIEEFIALYGEDAVLGAYCEMCPDRMIEAIGKSGAIKNPKAKYVELRDRLDLINMEEEFLFTNYRVYKKDFIRFQKFFIREFLEKEINFALKSGNRQRVLDVRNKLQILCDFNFSVDGKNLFEDVAARFNSKVSKVNGSQIVSITTEVFEGDISELSPEQKYILSQVLSKEMNSHIADAYIRVNERIGYAVIKLKNSVMNIFNKGIMRKIDKPRSDILVMRPIKDGNVSPNKTILVDQIRG